MTDSQPYRVVLIDDHPAIIEALRAFLETVLEFKVVGTAKNIQEAKSVIRNSESPLLNEIYRVNEIDLVIVDIRLPDADGKMIHDGGINLTTEFSERYPDMAILIYSADAKLEPVRRALAAGASGYLLKGTDIPVIKQAIAVVMAGGTYLDPGLPGRLKRPLKGETLTRKEEEIMHLFSQWKTRKEIAHILQMATVTVNAHCINISSKLGLRSPIEFYREAIRRYGNPDDV